MLSSVALAVALGGCGSATAAPSASPSPSSPTGQGGFATPSIWAGYRTSIGGITSVIATWIQPWVEQRGVVPNVVVFWVGLEGQHTDTVEQIGTGGYCDGVSTGYDAWHELFPKPAVTIDLAVNPTDTVTATVASIGHDCFRLTLVDDTTHARFATTQVARGVGDTAGAIAVERRGTSDVGLAGFDPVHFTRCALNGQPIGGFRLTSFDIASDDGTVETTTSPVATGGTSFTVTRRRLHSTPPDS
jgi:hypothetical protein